MKDSEWVGCFIWRFIILIYFLGCPTLVINRGMRKSGILRTGSLRTLCPGDLKLFITFSTLSLYILAWTYSNGMLKCTWTIHYCCIFSLFIFFCSYCHHRTKFYWSLKIALSFVLSIFYLLSLFPLPFCALSVLSECVCMSICEWEKEKKEEKEKVTKEIKRGQETVLEKRKWGGWVYGWKRKERTSRVRVSKPVLFCRSWSWYRMF